MSKTRSAILRGLKEKYEVHHGVRIKDSAIVAAATLSHRYITDRFLPDKAIDLIDEAAASLRIQIDSLPTDIDQLDRKATQLEIEKQALKKEDDVNSRDRLAVIEKELAEIRETLQHAEGQLEKRKRSHRAGPRPERADRKAESRRTIGIAQRQLRARRRNSLRPDPAGGAGTRQAEQANGKPGRQADAEGRSRRRRRRPHRLQVDRNPGLENARRRSQKVSHHGRPPAPARCGPGRGSGARRQRHSPFPRWTQRSQTPDRLVYFSRPDGRRQDRTRPRPRRISIRRRACPAPHRHVGIHGEALRRPPDRRAPGLCRL